ncbi:MAG: UDP-N-acetylmuramate:L-alanyl-gamma-D-glutamyl-meso-diaminopimelate ligase [Pseudohongiellaceae bacterium]|nr:UDP-N-acetylmuramate:L-alanyl-gamma-D-glutamyl-meso-diaminopimelate ligase [Pseudohongiellaceae bacterium]
MHIHILGICGTFMGSLAVLAKQLGHTVSGSDANVYPPMSTQLEEQGIVLQEGFCSSHLQPHPDLVVIGNAMSRGNEAVEYVLEQGLEYCSGPEWLARYVLKQRWVLAVAGTHGKTSTSSMLAWILTYAGLQPGYLIGGVAQNFPSSASIGESPFFVVEADEYDSAFFDKRSKFVHYSPRTAIFNNLEFDHGDIFDDLSAIVRQFHHLVRIIPRNGLILSPKNDQNLAKVFELGCWSERQSMSLGEASEDSEGLSWEAKPLSEDASVFTVAKRKGAVVQSQATVEWELGGLHNISNAMAAMAAAHHVGVELTVAAEALASFKGVKRRQELLGEIRGVRVFDDFAHHPTAIATTLAGMRAKFASANRAGRLIAVIEPRSSTMKMGIHQSSLGDACRSADMTYWYDSGAVELDLLAVAQSSPSPAVVMHSLDEILTKLVAEAEAGDDIVIMSNGGFGGIHQRLLDALAQEDEAGHS